MLRVIRRAPLLLAIEIVVTLVFALVPSNSILVSLQLWDKAQHVMVFALLAITASLAYPTRRLTSAAGLLAFGVAIEIMQTGLTLTRSGEFVDVVADGCGILLGTLLYFLARPYLCAVTKRSEKALPLH